MNPFQVVRDFEQALCEYTGAPYAVTTTSCTMALLLAVAYHNRAWTGRRGTMLGRPDLSMALRTGYVVEIPKRTYVSVPMAILHAGSRPVFREQAWEGRYRLDPLPIWDCARWFTSSMFASRPGEIQKHPTLEQEPERKMMCVSFHATKILGDTQGGAILHADPEADAWLRRARFDGRTEGVAPKDDIFDMIGWHCYMSPDVAARLLNKLSRLPADNPPLPNDDYPDLSQMEIFQ